MTTPAEIEAAETAALSGVTVGRTVYVQAGDNPDGLADAVAFLDVSDLRTDSTDSAPAPLYSRPQPRQRTLSEIMSGR